ncbi:MAG: N-acetyl-alpha-D-glucosaminyl L-malate synthase BshA [Myxococcales bacterium]|nr:N-acetyl-alpha-D-glucosaminyl L-malate synthase BshA [Myxococcales bacterium]
MTSYPSFGGSASVAASLAEALDARGHRVRFVATEVPPTHRLPSSVPFDRVDVPGYSLFGDGFYTVALADKLADVARADGIDIIHVHYALPHAVSAYLAKQMLGPAGPSVVVTMHGTDVTRIGAEPAYRDALRFAVLAADARSVPSHYLAGAARRRFDLPREVDIDVIANFVDCEALQPKDDAERARSARELAGAARGQRVLCHVSNFRRVKRAPDVVRVFAAVRQRGRDARLLMVGDGPEHDAARTLARELGVDEHVTWTGSVGDVQRYLYASDLFLLTSEEESFGLAALEALASGVPVVATDVGGVSEVVAHDKTGLLVPLGDIEAMTRAVERLLGDDAKRANFAAAAHRDAERRFCLPLRVAEYEAMYERVLAGKRHRAHAL